MDDTWLLLFKAETLENGNLKILSFPHPAEGILSKYCLDDNTKKIYEIVKFEEKNRSWFIGNTVQSFGGLLQMTPIHFTFLILPLLKKECAKRAIPLEDLLTSDYYNLKEYIPTLEHIADSKGPKDMKCYQYNEKKTLEWLKDRVERLAKVLRLRNIQVTTGAVSTTFVNSSTTISQELFMHYAFTIVAQYLPEDIAELLKMELNFNSELIESMLVKRKSDCNHESSNKKVKLEEIESFKENENKNTPPTKALSSKQKNLQKSASGSKKISAFFTKK